VDTVYIDFCGEKPLPQNYCLNQHRRGVLWPTVLVDVRARLLKVPFVFGWPKRSILVEHGLCRKFFSAMEILPAADFDFQEDLPSLR
jgi:hypothetical protein